MSVSLDDSIVEIPVVTEEPVEFQPIRAGGQKLNDTIELSDDDDEEDSQTVVADESGDDTRFATALQTPGGAGGGRDTPADAQEPFQTSTPMVSGSFHFVKDPGHANPFDATAEIRDEFHQTDSTLQDELSDDEASPVVSTMKRPSSAGQRPGSDEEATPASGPSSRQPTPKKRRLTQVNLPDTCTVLSAGPEGGQVFLVGTAHFSHESQADVARVISQVQPDVVMIELCRARSPMLMMNEERILHEAENLSLATVRTLVREKGVMGGGLYMLMLSVSSKLTRELGMAPGGEFRTAYQEAKLVPGCMVHLGDRPIDITMKRAMGALTWWQKVKFGLNLLFCSEKITAEDVEKCKQKDLLESILAEMAGEYPELINVLVHERDLFLAFSLRTALESRRVIMDQHPDQPKGRPPVVVGVVGIGHVAGIKAHWDTVSAEDVSRVVRLPLPTVSQVVVGHVIRFGLLAGLVYGGYRLARGPLAKFIP